MGTGKLHALAMSGDRELAGAALALHAELANAQWNDEQDLARDFPHAEIRTGGLVISMPSSHCVALIINLPAGLVLIEYAGPSGHLPSLGSRAASSTRTARTKA